MPRPLPIVPTLFIGVDPGDGGGLACVSLPPEEKSPVVLSAVPMPDTEGGVLDWLCKWTPRDCIAVLEKVGGYIEPQTKGGDSGFVAGSAAMFNFGCSYGGLRMALTARGIVFTDVTPQAWQKGLGIPKRTKAEDRTRFKNRLKDFAATLFPRRTMTLGIADAILIAEYCRRFKPLPGYLSVPDFG